jgi:hypothetical protein
MQKEGMGQEITQHQEEVWTAEQYRGWTRWTRHFANAIRGLRYTGASYIVLSL